jgi:hypothetical protein
VKRTPEVKRESRRLRGEAAWFSRSHMRGRVNEKYAQPASGPGGVYVARLPTQGAIHNGRVLRFDPQDGSMNQTWWDDCDTLTEDELRATAKLLAERSEMWWKPRPPTARELLGDAVLDELVAATEKRLLARMRAMEIPVALSPEDDDGREAIERAAAEAIGGLRSPSKSSSKSSLRALWSGRRRQRFDLGTELARRGQRLQGAEVHAVSDRWKALRDVDGHQQDSAASRSRLPRAPRCAGHLPEADVFHAGSISP